MTLIFYYYLWSSFALNIPKYISKYFNGEPHASDNELDPLKLQKMAFLYNALENGWTVKKKKDLYIFSKNHQE